MTPPLRHGVLWSGDPKDPEISASLCLAMIIVAVLLFVSLHWEDWQKGHLRHARLAAYQRRRQWRKSDKRQLAGLGIPQHRIERIIDANRRLGRGVVQRYRSFEEMVADGMEQCGLLLSPETPPHTRLSTLKRTPLWPVVVEGLYRGEHASAKEKGERSPSARAEELVAACLGISDSSVHKICGTIRKARRLKGKSRESAPLFRVSEFEAWKRDGNLQTL